MNKESVALVKNQIKLLERKILREFKDKARWRKIVDESEQKLTLWKKEKEGLEIMIEPYVLVENIDDKNK